jgi:glycosyltransferase involved in cell wall biosynthesis
MHCTNTFPLISPSAYYAAHAEGVPVVQSLQFPPVVSECLFTPQPAALRRLPGEVPAMAGRPASLLSRQPGRDSRRVPLKTVGDGPLAGQVRAAIAANGAVEFLGHRPIEEVLSLLGDAAFLVMPSIWYETFGRTIIEAYAKATPVIASRLGAIAELVDHGRTGLLFEPGDADDLARKVEQWVTGGPAPTAIRQAAREEYELKYTAARNFAALTNIYREALLRCGRLAGEDRNLWETQE